MAARHAFPASEDTVSFETRIQPAPAGRYWRMARVALNTLKHVPVWFVSARWVLWRSLAAGFADAPAVDGPVI